MRVARSVRDRRWRFMFARSDWVLDDGWAVRPSKPALSGTVRQKRNEPSLLREGVWLANGLSSSQKRTSKASTTVVFRTLGSLAHLVPRAGAVLVFDAYSIPK
jgi:hypothetical protein